MNPNGEGFYVHDVIEHLVYAHRRRLLESPEGVVQLEGILKAAETLAFHINKLQQFADINPPIPVWISPESLLTFVRSHRQQRRGRKTAPKGPGANPKVAGRFLAYDCAEALRAFDVKATSGPRGTIAKLASAIHTIATGEKASFTWDANLVRDPNHAAAELFKVAPPRRMTEDEVAELRKHHPKRFRK